MDNKLGDSFYVYPSMQQGNVIPEKLLPWHATGDHEPFNLIMQNKPNLLNTQMNVSSFITKDYGNVHLLGRRKNKAKQTQSNPISKANELLKKEVVEHKKTEDKMKEEMEVKSQFVSMVSHELRTPITALKEGIRLVVQEKTGKLNDEQKEFLSLAKRNVDRLARLINDVLDFQKLEAGRMDFNFHENDINKIVKNVYDTMSPATKCMELDFLLKLEDNLPKVKFDSDKIVQVLTNMVSNAIKFLSYLLKSEGAKKGTNLVT